MSAAYPGFPALLVASLGVARATRCRGGNHAEGACVRVFCGRIKSVQRILTGAEGGKNFAVDAGVMAAVFAALPRACAQHAFSPVRILAGPTLLVSPGEQDTVALPRHPA